MYEFSRTTYKNKKTLKINDNIVYSDGSRDYFNVAYDIKIVW